MDREGSVGHLYGSNQAIVIDCDGKQLGANEMGEICVKVQVPFLGYLGEPELTARSYHNGEFFKTGDIGYFDEDCFLYVVGRKKEMLRLNGLMVSSTEIEDIINSQGAVESSCVVGVPDNESENDILFAFVKTISSRSKSINEQTILDHVNLKLPDVKRLRGGVHFVEKFPMTPSGKIKKQKVKKIAMSISRTQDISETKM